MPLPTKIRLAFGAVLIVFFAWVGWEALDFAPLARYMPLFISGMGMVLGILSLITDIQTYRRTGTAVGAEAAETAALGSVERDLSSGGSGDAEGENPANASKSRAIDDESRDPTQVRESGDAAGSRPDDEPELADPRVRRREERHALLRALGYLSVIVGYVLLIWIAGVFVASAVFLLFFLRVLAKTSWVVPVVGVLAVLTGLVVMGALVNVMWPPYLLEDVLGDVLPG